MSRSRLTIRYNGYEKFFDYLKEKYRAESDAHVFRLALEDAYNHHTGCKEDDNNQDKTQHDSEINWNDRIEGYYMMTSNEKAKARKEYNSERLENAVSQ